MKKKIAIEFQQMPNEFKPKSPEDLLGPAGALAVAVMAHTMRVKPTSDGHLKVCFYGPPGTGKTTIANMIAEALANNRMDIESLNGRNVTIELVRDWQKHSAYASMFGGWTVKVINELDLVPMAAQELMLSFMDELRPRVAIIGTSNEQTNTLSERFKSRFQLVKVPAVNGSAIKSWLVKKWHVSETAASWISVACCGNVREALLQAGSYLQFGILPEKSKPVKSYTIPGAKCAHRVAVARQYWSDVRSGLRPAPGSQAA